MSGIAGIFNRDGRPVDRDLLARMTDAIAHRGPDGAAQWVDGAIGFGHQMLCTTPESLHETQPLRDAAAQLYLVMDGRVDNRAELKAAIEARGAHLRDDTDAELVLRAYDVWGEECPHYIIGDFAFAIWDGRRRQLFCARDFLGIKPFYYYLDGSTFRFGSELHQILEDESIERKPNEGAIGEYLAASIVNPEETLYQNIYRVPAGYILVIRNGSYRKEPYWVIETNKKLLYRSDSEYAEHFLEIFKQAVRCRLRSHKPVGAYLSGGLDSSSIIGVCQSLIMDGSVNVAGFETFSLLFPDRPECDESKYIEEVVNMWRLKAHRVSPNHIDPSIYADQVRFYRDIPDYPNGMDVESLKELACRAGVRVMLTGYGGDEWFTGSDYAYADLLRSFRVPELLREVQESIRLAGTKYTISRLFTYGIRPLFPQHLRGFVRDKLRPTRPPSWIDAQFAERIGLMARTRPEPIAHLSGSFTTREMYRTLTNSSLIHGKELQDRSAARFCLEERHPFNDRRVVEFAFMLPEEQRYRRFQTKVVLREAMHGLIPETIRQRLDKAEFSHLFPLALRMVGGKQVFQDMMISERGLVNDTEVRRMYDYLESNFDRDDENYIVHIWRLWLIYGVEQWLRAHDSQKGQSYLKGGWTRQNAVLSM